MKSTRKYLLALCVISFGLALPTATLRAEDGPPSEKEHGPKGEREDIMKEKLGLSNDQAAKIKQTHDDARAEMKKIRDDQSLSKKQKMAAMKENREATKAKVDAVLTPEQRTKADEMRKKGEQMRKEKGEGTGEKGAKDEKGGKKKPQGE